MTRLEKMKIKRESVTLQARLAEAKAEIDRIRRDHDYLDSEILDVLCFPIKQQIDQLRSQLLSNLLQRFLLLSEAEQDRVLEAVKLEEERMRGESH